MSSNVGFGSFAPFFRTASDGHFVKNGAARDKPGHDDREIQNGRR
jgi:hypothetical protein